MRWRWCGIWRSSGRAAEAPCPPPLRTPCAPLSGLLKQDFRRKANQERLGYSAKAQIPGARLDPNEMEEVTRL